MTDKLKRFIAKIKLRIMLTKCYNEMERKGIAIFGMCSGKWHNTKDFYEFSHKQCTICRYFREVLDNDR